MSSAGFSRRTSGRDRGKLLVAILLGLLLIGALFLRSRFTTPVLETPSINVDEAAELATDNVVVDAVEGGATGLENALAVDGGEAAVADSAEIELAAPEPAPEAATLADFSEPLVNSAVVGYDGDGNELLTIAGSGDTRCEEIRFIIDGKQVGATAPDADGSWAITMSDLPKAGNYMSEIECDAEGNVYTAAPRSFELPEAPVAEDAGGNSAENTAPAEPEEVSTDNSDQVNAGADATTAEAEAVDTSAEETNTDEALVEEAQDPDTPDEQPPVDPNVKQPEFWIAQDLGKYTGGPLLIKGVANRGQIIEIILDNGTTKVADTATADDNGDWAMRAMLTEPGNYSVRAQLAGTSAEPATNVVVPDGLVFGSKGDCIGKTPPYGTIEGKSYIVNHCEFFSIIADRLGVTFAELRAANQQIINLDYITAGDTINIP